MDIGLPDGRGDALALELRQTRPDLPIVIATGYAIHTFTRPVFAGRHYAND